jgi:hypothetical protein
MFPAIKPWPMTLIVPLTLVTPPPSIHPHLCLSLHRRLSPHPSYAYCPSGCRVTSRHAATSRPPAPLPLIAPLSRLLSGWLSHHLSSRHHRLPLPAPPTLIVLLPLIVPLLHLFSGWLSHHLSSRRRLPSTCASTSHRTATSHRATLASLVRLIVPSTLVTPPPSNHLPICLSSHHRLSLRPSCASFLAGCCVTSRHAATSRPPALRLSLHSTSHCAPLTPLVWLVVALPLIMPPPPVSLCPCLSAHCRLSLRPSCNCVYDADGRGDGQGNSQGNG